MSLSARDLFVIARNAGFSQSAAITAGAVALAESGGNQNATHRNTNGSTDYGLWQINSIHSDVLRGHQWQNPSENAKMAYVISSGGRNWLPWTTYKSGRYRAYVGQMRAAAAGNGAGTTTIPDNPVTPQTPTDSGGNAGGSGGGNVVSASLSGISLLTAASTWIRVAMILAGGLLVLLMVAIMLGRDVLSVRKTVGL